MQANDMSNRECAEESMLEESVKCLRAACEGSNSDFPFWQLQQCVELFVAIKKRIAERMEAHELAREDYDQRKFWVLVQCGVAQKTMAEDLKASAMSIAEAGLEEEIGPAATSGKYGHLLSILRDEYYDNQAQKLWHELTNRGREHFAEGERAGNGIAAAIVRVLYGIRKWEDDELPAKIYGALREFYDEDLPVLMKSAFDQTIGSLADVLKPLPLPQTSGLDEDNDKFEYDDEDLYILEVLDMLHAQLLKRGNLNGAEYISKVKRFVDRFLNGDEVEVDSYSFEISLERNNEIRYVNFYISNAEMEMCCGGSIDSGCGHDSYSNIAWSIAKGRHCEYDYTDIDSKVSGLLSCGAEFTINDDE